MEETKVEVIKKYGMIFLGSIITVIGINCFVVPSNLYNGGTIGVAQLIRTALISYLHFDFSFDIAGLINFFLNIPLLFLAYYKISKRFFIRSLFGIVTQTIFFSLITINMPILEDTLASCLIGGVISAYGCGIVLRSGGSGGGFDIIGMYFARKKNGPGVGQLSSGLNAIIYIICAFMFELPVAIYSVIYSLVFAFVLDKVHYQNINVSVTVISKVPYLQDLIMFNLRRGVTVWKAIGGYTEEECNVLYTVISKYEIAELKRCIYDVDPNAFIVVNEGLGISGNFDKRL